MISMLLYFGFGARAVPFGVRWVLIVCATVGFAEAALALRSLHP
jgi:hypothetical protein